MNKEIIKQYINFAIENWYNLLDWRRYKLNEIKDNFIIFYDEKKFENIKYCLINCITSENFIEAVVRWLIKEDNIDIFINSEFCKNAKFTWNYENLSEITILTIHQAIAIRDNKLEEFIINLL